VLQSIEKITSKLKLQPRIIAPLHGIVWRENPSLIVNKYVEWAKALPVKGKVVIIYSSMYGSVEAAVNEAVKELKRQQLTPVVFRFTDRERPPISDLISESLDAEAFVIGAATYENNIFPIMNYVIDLLCRKVSAEKNVLILSSYGWGGVAAKKMAETMTKAGFKVSDIVNFKGLPSVEDLKRIKKWVRELS